jgi:hypothetical protein
MVIKTKVDFKMLLEQVEIHIKTKILLIAHVIHED